MLDAVLEEFSDITPGNSRDNPEVEVYSLWADRKKGLLYGVRKDGCTQYLFPTKEKRNAIMQVLLRLGFRKGEA